MTLGIRLDSLRPIAEHAAIPDAYEIADRVRRVEVETIYEPTSCPKCGSAKLHRHGVRQQRYADVPHYGEPTHLLVNRRRWRCIDCHTLFPDPLPDMDENRRATNRLIAFVRERCHRRTFADIGREVGLSDVSIRSIFDDMLAELERRYRFVTPRYLGIDEVKIIGDYRCILTNVEHNTVYDLLPSRKKDSLRKYFSAFEGRKSVELFCTDFWETYADIAAEFFPDAVVVADRFHIQRMGNNALEAVRKRYRKSLTRKERITLKDERFLLLKLGSRLSDDQRLAKEDLLRRHPELCAAWECKERFFAIWESTTRYEANFKIVEWLASVPPELERPFAEAIRAFRNRREHILNYFDFPITNAYTEAKNGLAKDINRMGRGYTLEVVRAKLLYDPRAIEKGAIVERVPGSKPDTGRGRKPAADGLSTGYVTPEMIAEVAAAATPKVRKRYYGAHIPTLWALLQAGEFE